MHINNCCPVQIIEQCRSELLNQVNVKVFWLKHSIILESDELFDPAMRGVQSEIKLYLSYQ